MCPYGKRTAHMCPYMSNTPDALPSGRICVNVPSVSLYANYLSHYVIGRDLARLPRTL
jgi:hypothetical protein